MVSSSYAAGVSATPWTPVERRVHGVADTDAAASGGKFAVDVCASACCDVEVSVVGAVSPAACASVSRPTLVAADAESEIRELARSSMAYCT